MIKHKFRAKPQEYDGIKFASKKETQRYIHLQNLQKSGEVIFFLRQVPFHLPGGVKYLADYMVFWKNDTVTVEDVKGLKTPMYIAKKKIVEVTYPIEITEI